MSKRKTEEDYHKLAESRGFKWVGCILPKNMHTKTWWECENGHRWEAVYNNILQGTGCPFCSGKARKTKQDYHNLAIKCGIKWISDVLPKNVNTKTLWMCRKKHEWEARYHDISDGHNKCPICCSVMRKTEKDYYLLAESRGFKWVGDTLPKNIRIKVEWECKRGHRWKATYNDIDQGSGCPYCYGTAKKIEKDYYELAETCGFKWIGPFSKNTHIKTWWGCRKGHRWKATYHNIYGGSGCPYCRNLINSVSVSKQQIKLNTMLTGSLNYPESRYRIDVAIMRKSQKIAVEYDCWYWHNGNEEHDIIRDRFLISRGWKVLHIKSGRLLPTRKKLNIVIKHLLETNDVMYNIYLKDWKH